MQLLAISNWTETDGKLYWRVEVQYDPPVGWKSGDYRLIPDTIIMEDCDVGPYVVPLLVSFKN